MPRGVCQGAPPPSLYPEGSQNSTQQDFPFEGKRSMGDWASHCAAHPIWTMARAHGAAGELPSAHGWPRFGHGLRRLPQPTPFPFHMQSSLINAFGFLSGPISPLSSHSFISSLPGEVGAFEHQILFTIRQAEPTNFFQIQKEAATMMSPIIS